MAYSNSETIQEFAAKLPKESIMKGRRSICLSKSDILSKVNHPERHICADQKNATTSQALVDLRNHKNRNTHSTNSSTEDALSKNFDKDLNITDTIIAKPVTTRHSTSNEFKIPSLRKGTLQATRNRRTTATSNSQRRRSYLSTLKNGSSQRQQNHQNCPTAARSPATVVAMGPLSISMLPSRLKDPLSGSIFEKIKPRRYSVAVAEPSRRSPMCFSSKKLNALSSMRKKDDLSAKKMEPTGNRLNNFDLRSRLIAVNSRGMAKAKGQDGNECRRALNFQESSDEVDEDDTTKPLPLVNLTILEQSNEDESLLHSNKTIISAPSGTAEGQSQSSTTSVVAKGSTFLINSSSDITQKAKRCSRGGGIPVLKRKASPYQNESTLRISQTNTPVSTHKKSTLTPPSFKSGKENRVGRPKRIPLIKITRPSVPSSGTSPGEQMSHSKTSPSTEIESSSASKISPSAPPNSPSNSKKNHIGGFRCNDDKASSVPVAASGKEQKTLGDSHDAENTSKYSQKDAATNTVVSSDYSSLSFSQMESQVQSVQAIMDSFEFSFQEMKLEFARKAELLLKQFQESLNSQDLKRELGTTFDISTDNPPPEVKENVEVKEVKVEERIVDVKEKKFYSNLKFLDTPLPTKNRRRIRRSASHPPSPDTFEARKKDDSFHSLESICVSPFTNLVGDCNRDSLLPTTPMTRSTVKGIKASLNEQLHLLFD